MQNRERVVSQDDLLAGVWDGRIISESAMRSRINAARAAIGDNGEEQRLIRTMPRKGFRFVGSVREEQEGRLPIATEKDSTAIVGARPAEPGTGMTYNERVELAPTIVERGGAAAKRCEEPDAIICAARPIDTATASDQNC